MNDWNIQSRARACQACATPFAHKETCHTLLFEFKHDIERQDLCEACWKAGHQEAARHRKGFLSHWQGLYEAPLPPREVIQKENAESLLRKIVEANDPQYAAAGYILAVMLERKRLLKVKEQLQGEGARIFIYEHPQTGDLFTIPDPSLQLNQLDSVQRAVAALLEHGFGARAPDQPPAEPPPDSGEGTEPAGAAPGESQPVASIAETESLSR
jgi:hypothetical protein